MKLSREKRIILLAALAGMVITMQTVSFIERLKDLAGAIEAKPDDKLPTLLRRRYVPVAKRKKAVNE